jgi:hypothetical protein
MKEPQVTTRETSRSNSHPKYLSAAARNQAWLANTGHRNQSGRMYPKPESDAKWWFEFLGDDRIVRLIVIEPTT